MRSGCLLAGMLELETVRMLTTRMWEFRNSVCHVRVLYCWQGGVLECWDSRMLEFSVTEI